MTIVYALVIWAAVQTVGSGILLGLLIHAQQLQTKINESNEESIEWLNGVYLDLATAHDILLREHAALVRQVKGITAVSVRLNEPGTVYGRRPS